MNTCIQTGAFPIKVVHLLALWFWVLLSTGSTVLHQMKLKSNFSLLALWFRGLQREPEATAGQLRCGSSQDSTRLYAAQTLRGLGARVQRSSNFQTALASKEMGAGESTRSAGRIKYLASDPTFKLLCS
jgi:hypothetical protein